MKTIIFVIAFTASIAARANFEQCRSEFPDGVVPKIVAIAQPAGGLRALCFEGFAVLHSGDSRGPVYAVERLTAARIADAGDEQRTDYFYQEARLPFSDRAQLDDYKNSGYDRGHMAPAADMPTQNAMAQSFSLANIVPQSPKHNRGLWAKGVEGPTRKYVARAVGDVFVFTGAAYVNQRKTIKNIWIPTHIYKLVYDATTKKAWAYWTANSDDERMSAPVTYHELVRLTGIEFLPSVTVAP